ncbi:hypothetical protein GLOIN_2v1719386 [Rhizophagus clarus]|uniref:Uncharacterized protein n=1 Tax=Rhizophagus clarus TaxID=94130 RepID=A0A8H3QD46_9GLOM|nr:hypothetical protein GLOIN_2v1719386 [Rhizophagus clarus]
MADTTGYTSESDILDSFVYNLLPMFLFTMNFLDDTWNYNSSTGGRIFDDAIFIGTPFIATLVLIWVKNMAISYLIIQSLIFYREGEKNEKNNKNEGNEEYKKNEEVKEDVKNDNEENIDKNKKRNKEFIEIITRFIIWSILHGIVVTELWLFPINAYITKFYLLLYINCVALIFRYDSPEGIKFGIGFLNFIFIVNSNSLKEEFHLPVENFYFLGKNGSKDKVHNDRFKNIRNLYMK